MLRIRDFPEVAGIPLVLSDRHLITVPGEQSRLVGSIAMSTLPTGNFHEVAAQFDLAFMERALVAVTPGRVWLPRMHCGGIDFLRDFTAAPVDVVVFFLLGIEARNIDAMWVHLGSAVRHPVGDDFANARAIFDPDGLGKP